MIKLKIGPGSKAANLDQNAPPPTPVPSSASGHAPPLKLKLNLSQPPTPVEQSAQTVFPQSAESSSDKKKRPYQRKQDSVSKGKKRAANEDNLPLAKRLASGSNLPRKFSIKLGAQTPQLADDGGKATPKLHIGKRKQSVPKFVELRARGKAPPRPKGVGYDSEDSDVETDPAIQQALVLRMQDGEDADYLRQAIADGKVGTHTSQGDADVSLRFIEKNYRRAVIRIHGRMYAAVLVDLPCVVESLKSFDKKGWWKVADIAQMLLVLGRCNNEEEAKSYQMPREVNKNNFQYAHGLTPPMHMVRKRRFRKRLNYNDVINVEEEVERLLEADRAWQAAGGTVTDNLQERTKLEQSVEPQEYDLDEDADGEAIETVETDGQEYEEDAMEEDAPDDDLEAQMQAMFDAEDADVSELITESPAPMVDQAASMVAVESMVEDSEATPVGTPIDTGAETPQQYEQTSDEDESDEDEDDADSPDAFDEDAAAKAAERAQQLEEVQDLEREVERARQKAQAMTNQLLRQREMAKLSALEEDLRVKRGVFGLSNDED